MLASISTSYSSFSYSDPLQLSTLMATPNPLNAATRCAYYGISRNGQSIVYAISTNTWSDNNASLKVFLSTNGGTSFSQVSNHGGGTFNDGRFSSVMVSNAGDVIALVSYYQKKRQQIHCTYNQTSTDT